MKLKLVKVPRRLPWPAWTVAVVVGYIALVGLAVWLAQRGGGHVELCLFKRVTGYPCPTCGTGRGSLALLRGDLPAAWRFNPLVFTCLAALAAVLGLRLVLGRAVRVEMSRLEWFVVLAAGLAAVLANWAYVIVYVG
jgi:hypothetical protein